MMSYFKALPDHYKYGIIVFVCVLFVGWITRMGGSFLPNLAFSALMGVFAGFLFYLVKRSAGKSGSGKD